MIFLPIAATVAALLLCLRYAALRIDSFVPTWDTRHAKRRERRVYIVAFAAFLLIAVAIWTVPQ